MVGMVVMLSMALEKCNKVVTSSCRRLVAVDTSTDHIQTMHKQSSAYVNRWLDLLLPNVMGMHQWMVVVRTPLGLVV